MCCSSFSGGIRVKCLVISTILHGTHQVIRAFLIEVYTTNKRPNNTNQTISLSFREKHVAPSNLKMTNVCKIGYRKLWTIYGILRGIESQPLKLLFFNST